MVILSTPTQSWETMDGRKINEGPAILVNEEKGKLFIVYSCNPSWTKNYRLAWLMLDMNDGDPMNPADWQKSSNYAFWRCDNTKEPVSGVNGLGHCTFTKSPDGNRGLDRLPRHALLRRRLGPALPLRPEIHVERRRNPDFGEGAGWGEPLLLPSGETL